MPLASISSNVSVKVMRTVEAIVCLHGYLTSLPLPQTSNQVTHKVVEICKACHAVFIGSSKYSCISDLTSATSDLGFHARNIP